MLELPHGRLHIFSPVAFLAGGEATHHPIATKGLDCIYQAVIEDAPEEALVMSGEILCSSFKYFENCNCGSTITPSASKHMAWMVIAIYHCKDPQP